MRHRALYEYNCLPMGTCASAQLFQKVMNTVLEGLPAEKGFTYLDDVLIATRTFEEHVEVMDMVFKKVREGWPDVAA